MIATKLYNLLLSKLYIHSVTDTAYDMDIGKFSNMIYIVYTYLNFQMALISVKEKLWVFIYCSQIHDFDTKNIQIINKMYSTSVVNKIINYYLVINYC